MLLSLLIVKKLLNACDYENVEITLGCQLGNLFDTEEMTFPLLSTLLFLMLDLSSNDEIEDKLLQSQIAADKGQSHFLLAATRHYLLSIISQVRKEYTCTSCSTKDHYQLVTTILSSAKSQLKYLQVNSVKNIFVASL